MKAFIWLKAYLFDGIRATPVLSYTVRRLNCISGIVITPIQLMYNLKA